MRIVFGCILGYLALVGTAAHASGSSDVVKVKTGISPNGGFYRLYQVDCDEGTAAIASLDGNRRWCNLKDGALSCFSKQQDASLSACASSGLAATGYDVDEADHYQ